MACADAVPVAAMVDGDHAVPRRQRLEAPQPVETTGRRQAVQQHDGGRTRGTGCFAYERRAAAGELDEPPRGYEGRRRHQRGLTHLDSPVQADDLDLEHLGRRRLVVDDVTDTVTEQRSSER